jgi:hypothetical protein
MLISRFFILLGCILIIGCTSSSSSKDSEIVKKSKPIKSKTSGVLYKPSELALIMRKMYSNMSLVGEHIDSGQDVTDSLLVGYEAILYAEATNPEEINEQFFGFANIWLGELKSFSESRDINSYNNLMNACVNCHQSFCPGPISKIKRLKLVP